MTESERIWSPSADSDPAFRCRRCGGPGGLAMTTPAAFVPGWYWHVQRVMVCVAFVACFVVAIEPSRVLGLVGVATIVGFLVTERQARLRYVAAVEQLCDFTLDTIGRIVRGTPPEVEPLRRDFVFCPKCDGNPPRRKQELPAS